MKHLKYVVMASLILMGCSDAQPVDVGPGFSPAPSPEGETVAFAVVAQLNGVADTTLRIRVTWKAPNDGFGLPEYYLHSMISSKVVVDAVTGPLPTSKRANGLADTVSIKLNLVNDTVTLTSRVWSVRRTLLSTSPAVATLLLRRGDRPPPPPDSIKVDTIVLPEAPPTVGSVTNLLSIKSISEIDNSAAYRSLFIREENGTTTYKVGTNSYITLIVK
jgi:hypothetical protein